MSELTRTPNKSDGSDSVGNSTADLPEDWVAIGEIVGTFGTRGELKILPLTDFPDRFERTSTVFAGEKRIPFHILEARSHKQHIVLRLDGISSMDGAERLRGATLWIPADQITALPGDQFYLHDLIGMRVRHVNGNELGVVADVMTAPGIDHFVIQTPDGGEVLLPAVKAFIKTVDVAARSMTVEPIPGLFDDHADVAE